jgi:hypothetical protein
LRFKSDFCSGARREGFAWAGSPLGGTVCLINNFETSTAIKSPFEIFNRKDEELTADAKDAEIKI